LDYAHRAHFGDGPEGTQGIVHRDVSPSNVLLSFDDEVKLCNFGIARAVDLPELEEECSGEAAPSETPSPGALSAAVESKAGYMSPEQARGEALDGRSDVYAAGILLWEILAGRRL